MNLAELNDGELIRLFADQKSSAAFELLLQRHRQRVYATCRRITGSIVDAEDATQIVFALFADHASELKSHPSPEGWLCRTAWHVSAKLRRTAQRRTRRERQVAEGSQIAYYAKHDLLDLHSELSLALSAMPRIHRDAIVLYHLKGMTLAQMSQLTGEPIGTLAGRLSRARIELRAHLEARGCTLHQVGLPELLILKLSQDISVAPNGRAILDPASECADTGLTMLSGGSNAALTPKPIFEYAAVAAKTAGGGGAATLVASWFTVRTAAVAICASVSVGAVGYQTNVLPFVSHPEHDRPKVSERQNRDEKYASSGYAAAIAVPEPGSAAVAGGAIAALGFRRPRRGR